MPAQKRVHFADNCVTYAPQSPRTPSPSHSDSSLHSQSSASSSSSSSTADPPTPPPVEYIPSPYPRTSPSLLSDYSPPKNPTANPVHMVPPHMNVHYLLAYSPFTEPALGYDFSTLPTDAVPRPHELLEPATNPPLHHMVVICPLLPSRWQIDITAAPRRSSPPLVLSSSPPPSSSSSASYITVADVLTALYRNLRLSVTREEYNSLGDSPEREHVNQAYFSRCERIFDPVRQGEEKNKGVKRIDFLKNRCRFLGLSGTLASTEIWEVNLA
ncbi:hypothetical protein AMATHDRAFT_200950 [Amanita thiersii Skay4041]|uniref:DUF6699 domain-containing protein n=1 Tax=Amanita thiersii Skay4041 TaxID=703135 RepID=A0A2A9NA69_9AGAR|nr:hypothetical protein AMATHDRAFT_200950 [Amanita thiersii Skay4041]